jgi:hypothetical protein
LESDPQGYTHGWGDLHLKPRDAAKLGYLWLNQGVWEGVQIVSADWVEEAVKPHGNISGYGYGWWISKDSYYAFGRGGQNIKIAPSLNAIVVTSGSGFEYDEISPYLTAAVIDPARPLPANAKGVTQLNAAMTALAQPLSPLPVSPLPDTAKAISGKTYFLEPNSAGVDTLRLEFNGPAEAALYMKRQGSDVIWRIGLDNKYRLASDGSQLRGYWADPQTFMIEVFDIGLNTCRFHFKDGGVVINVSGLTLQGQIETQ